MSLSHDLLNAQKQLQQMREQIGYRPTISIGAGETAVSQHITTQLTIQPASRQPEELEAINHHGDIALAALRSGDSCHYQLWLALRLLDATGSGHVALSAAKDALTEESSDSFMYQAPRLKQLLAEGNGRFWQLTDERLWLRSTVRVAHVLGVERLNGRFFSIAKDDVTGRTAVFRAHCYAAWLSNHTNPMSQATIERLTGLTPRTQRRYCQLANIEVQQNITIGPAAHADRQEIAWQHGNTFEFTDFQGQQGPAHRRYIAWHLPANYAVNGPQGSRRQQKRHNQQLAGLATTETPGNGQFAGTRLFFANGKAAAKAANRQMSGVPATDIYWQQRRAKSGTGIWNVIGGHATAFQPRATA